MNNTRAAAWLAYHVMIGGESIDSSLLLTSYNPWADLTSNETTSFTLHSPHNLSPTSRRFPANLCLNSEGWGPSSAQRTFGFTPCFEDAALWIAPVLVLSLFSAAQLVMLGRQTRRKLTKASSALLATKDAVLASLIVVAALHVGFTYVGSPSPLRNIEFWASAVGILGYVVALPLQHLNHLRTRRSSTLLLFYWLAHTIASAVKLRTLTTTPSPPLHDHAAAVALFCIKTSLVIVLFGLECAGIEVGRRIMLAEDETPRHKATCANGHSHHVQHSASNGGPNDSAVSATSEAASHHITIENECPVVIANVWSRLSFHWMQPLMTLGSQKFLGEDDMWSLPPGEDAESLGRRFATNWEGSRNAKTGSPALWTTLAKSYGGPFFLAAVFKAAQDALAFLQPYLLRQLLQFVQQWDQDEHSNPIKGYFLSACLFSVALMQTACLHQYFQLAFTTGMRVRAGLVSAIFQKALRLSNEDRGGRSTGDIVNLMSVDATRLQDLCTYGHIVWSGFFQCILAFVSLYVLLGWPAFVGVAIMVVSIPLNTLLARIMKKMSERQMHVKDQRTRIMNEILVNIKSIKLFAWEKAFEKKLFKVRNEDELQLLRKTGGLSSIFQFVFNVVPFCVSLATFTTYALTSDKPLTADVIFPALSLFSLLQFPIAMIANVISSVIQASVSARRLERFLDAGELDSKARKMILPPSARDSSRPHDQLGDVATTSVPLKLGDEVVIVRDGEFKWSRNQPVPSLQDINLAVKKGELLAVLGKVGDGKTSLLAALLGEMYRSDGEVVLRGRTAYFSQGGWAMGESVRHNITFGLAYEADFYQRVLDACALGPDLAILPNGDETEIGERGVSLSGGQRARVALARAVYARADIYLLDDPLSAVDAHVASHIWKHVIGPDGMLKTKARILTTNNVSFLKECDQIVSVRRGIILSERGSFAEVMSNKGEIFNLITGLGKQSSTEEPREVSLPAQDADLVDHDNSLLHHGEGGEEVKMHRRLSTSSMAPKTLSKKQIRDGTIRQLRDTTQPKENREQGAVSKGVYLEYIKSSSLIGVSMYMLAQLSAQALQISRDFVLKQWGSSNIKYGDSEERTHHYLILYATVGFTSSAALTIAPFILWLWLVIRSAKHFHDAMYASVMRAPLQYFETIPTGRLLNLFTRDVNVIDEVLPRVLGSAVRTSVVVLGVVILVSYSVPPFIIFIFPLAYGYSRILTYYLKTSRELKRLDATTKSPIFQYFSETLSGLSVVRAFGQQTRFIATSDARVDRNQQCYLPSVTANRWLAVRIELVGSAIILAASTLAVFLKTRNGAMDAGLLGLMMSQALNTTQSLNWVVRSASDVEQNIVSVERVMSYSHLTPEAPYEIPETQPEESWPRDGCIEFRGYSTRYRPELSLVLKNLSFRIESGERIGVVGRTGAGKSSLTLAFFRIIEAAQGSIWIDGVDTSTIGLKTLREALSIIPQDPQLWEGTLRDNLDPTGRSDDAALWKALDSAKLRDHVNSLDGRLDTQLSEGGTNFSAGQRQLICIARAFLRKSRILVLDEATASIDLETDDALQSIVRTEFQGTTITIAHRLNTIMDSSRILVLKDGEIAEFDTPARLLENKESIFFSMAQEAGLVGKRKR